MASVRELTRYFEASDVNSRGILFVGEGKFYGEGKIFRSDDGGGTWKEVFDIPDEFKPRSVRLCFIDSEDRIFIGALERLYRSVDDGKTWMHVLDFPAGSHEPWGIDEDLMGCIYVSSHGKNSTVFKSSDGGDSWEDVTGPWSSRHIHDIKCSSKTGWVYVVTAFSHLGTGLLSAPFRLVRRYLKRGHGTPGIWRSKDGGKTWAYIVRSSKYRLGFAVDGITCFIGSEHSGSENYIYRFIDDGSCGPFTPIKVHTFPASYGQPVIAGRVVGTGEDAAYLFSTGNTAGPTGTSQVVYSPDGYAWEVLDSKDSVAPRRSYYFLSHHSRDGYIYTCKYPRGIVITF